MSIFTKFHEDRTKNVDLLLMANFRMWALFIDSDLVCLFVCLLEVRGSDIPPGCAVWSVHSQEFQFLGPLIIPLLRNLART